MMKIFSSLTKKDKENVDFNDNDKFMILEVQLSYDFNNQLLIKLMCTKIQKLESDGAEYIVEGRYSEHVRYFFFPATEEYKDFFLMFAQVQKPIKFKSQDFKIKSIKESETKRKVKAYVKDCIITLKFTEPEKLMTPLA